MNLDPSGEVSRMELYNRSAHAFEGNNLVETAPRSVVDGFVGTLKAWASTTDPILPNTMGATSKHLGCDAYTGPTTGAASAASGLGVDKAATPDWQYRL